MKQNVRVAFAVGKDVLRDLLPWGKALLKALLLIAAIFLWDVLIGWLAGHYSLPEHATLLVANAVALVLVVFTTNKLGRRKRGQ